VRAIIARKNSVAFGRKGNSHLRRRGKKMLETATEARSRLMALFDEAGISTKIVDEIISHNTVIHYEKGSKVFLQGSPADLLFWVLAGLAKVYCPLSDGTQILVKLARPGDIIGHVAYLDSRGQQAQAFEVEALTKCSVALITREHVIKLMQALDHATLLRIIERLNIAWSSTAQWSGIFLGMPFRKRLEVVLNELGSKFGVRDKRGILLTPELSHADLADMIGSSRPMVSRLIAEMNEDGLLARQGKHFILKSLTGESSGSSNQPTEQKSFQEPPLEPSVRRPFFKQSVGGKSERR
jgi:CRP/FNR family cyclic AMP-dependent transcriptional regulator